MSYTYVRTNITETLTGLAQWYEVQYQVALVYTGTYLVPRYWYRYSYMTVRITYQVLLIYCTNNVEPKDRRMSQSYVKRISTSIRTDRTWYAKTVAPIFSIQEPLTSQHPPSKHHFCCFCLGCSVSVVLSHCASSQLCHLVCQHLLKSYWAN
jgi:hypothetical protein